MFYDNQNEKYMSNLLTTVSELYEGMFSIPVKWR